MSLSTHVNGTAHGGIAYITLEGDQIVWISADASQSRILLHGSHFRNVVAVVTLVLSALYGIAFLVILVQYLRKRAPKAQQTDKQDKKVYKWSVGTAMLCMVL